MLYLSFRFSLVFTAFMGILIMIAREEYDYIYFPIVMVLWVFYTFFQEEDKEYRRRNGEYHTIGTGIFDYDCWEDTWLYGGDTYPQYNKNHKSTRFDNSLYTKTVNSTKNDPVYKKVPKKYKRTLKITVYNEKDKDEKSKD